MLDFVVVLVENAPSVSGMRACLALNIVKLVRIVQAQTEKTKALWRVCRCVCVCFTSNLQLYQQFAHLCETTPKTTLDDITLIWPNTSMNHTSLSDFLSESYLHKMSFNGGWMRPSGCHIFLLFKMPPDLFATVMWHITLTRKEAVSTRWKDGHRHLVFRRGISQSVFRLSPLHVNSDKDQIEMPKSNSEHSCLCSACCSSIRWCLVYS